MTKSAKKEPMINEMPRHSPVLPASPSNILLHFFGSFERWERSDKDPGRSEICGWDADAMTAHLPSCVQGIERLEMPAWNHVASEIEQQC